ncbi:hypothetical protein JOE21_003549 [Desmospora profundinema]|uniref:Uncharacterized protein n=1 Tax=Desmospora profundinema TaxID=1571184 RepID=A0ABU1IS53_9BACL|nr:hypothetical protein [Desmospora profundinema]
MANQGSSEQLEKISDGGSHLPDELQDADSDIQKGAPP